MHRIPLEKYNIPKYNDLEVIQAWKWFLSFISEAEWQKRKTNIETKIEVNFRVTKPFFDPLTEGTLIVVKDDVIGWYLYLVDMLINEPHKYEYFQGARIVPIFKRFGMDLGMLQSIEGVEKRVKELMRRRRSEADALLFELLTALLWARNGYEVAFLEEKQIGKTPDFIAKKGNVKWYIECKRQSKTSDYTYRETAKRQKMISFINEALIKNNILLDIVFHVELETLPDNYLKDLLEGKLEFGIAGKIVSNKEVDIQLEFVDIPAIRRHLKDFSVKNPSPQLNALIGKKPVDNKGFTSGLYANFFRVGEGNVNNLYVSDVGNAYGVFWRCDAKEAVAAKARNIKNQVHGAIQQFSSDGQSVVHIGMETFDGPEVEEARFEKIKDTIAKIDPFETSLKWIFCHFFQAYSPPNENWIFDETVSTISPFLGVDPPISKRLLIVPEDADTLDGLSHWERPLADHK